jgi:hypothetical protein
LHHTTIIQHQRAQWHDKFIKKKKFKVGDWALLFDSKFKDFRGKFHTRWLGLMRLILYMTMEPSKFTPLMRDKSSDGKWTQASIIS